MSFVTPSHTSLYFLWPASVYDLSTKDQKLGMCLGEGCGGGGRGEGGGVEEGGGRWVKTSDLVDLKVHIAHPLHLPPIINDHRTFSFFSLCLLSSMTTAPSLFSLSVLLVQTKEYERGEEIWERG